MSVLSGRSNALFLLLLATSVALAACDEERDVTPDADGGPPGDDQPPPDKPVGTGIMIDEAAITARVSDGSTEVTIRLAPVDDGAFTGRITLELLQISDDSVVAQTEAPFGIAGGPVDVVLELPWGAPRQDVGAPLANYVLSYRAEEIEDPVWGRRSLLTAAKLPESQVRGSDVLQTGTPGRLRILSRDPISGATLPNVPVRVLLELPAPAEGQPAPEPVELFAGQTDDAGEVVAEMRAEDGQEGEAEVVVVIGEGAGAEEVRENVRIERASKTLLTTDKPLYQPGQTIHIRALTLRRPKLTPEAGQSVVFEVFDGKDNKVERVEAVSDDFGVASVRFKLAREVNMGTYRIRAGEAEKTVTVERYSLPKFDLDLELDREVYLAGSTLTGTVRARYFFGAAVAGGQVQVQASTLDVGETVFADVQGATNDEGLYQFEIQLPDYVVGLPLEQGGGLVQLALFVTDTAGQRRDVTRTIRIARGALEVYVLPESGVWKPGVPNNLLVRALDAAGRPAAASHDMSINGQDVPEFETDERGNATIRVDALDAQQLEVRVVSTDAEGESVTNDFTFVADPTAPEGVILLRPDRPVYRVGEDMGFDIFTVGARDRIFIDVIRGGQTVMTDAISPDEDGRARWELTLTPDHAGALTVEAWYLALGSSLRRDAQRIYVESADALNIEVTADRDVYAPAEEASVTFNVTDAEGNPRQAALGVQIVDEAVFSLMEFRPGLEKTYFRLEGDLATPRYQIGVPGLSTIATNPPAQDDTAAQEEARLLFAASEEPAAYPISVNTHLTRLQLSGNLIRPVVTGAVVALGETINESLGDDARSIGTDRIAQTIKDDIAAGRLDRIDPWGRPYAIELVNDYTLQMTTDGPDERPGTPDDVTASRNIDAIIWGDEPNRGGGGAGFDDEGDFAGGAGGEPNAPPNADVDGDGAAEEPGGGGPRVRRNFPETLLVEPSLITDADGEAVLPVGLADSITTWRITALANAVANGFGLLGSTTAGVTVFQDFFVDIDFPATLTRNDEYSVPVALYNYLDVPQQVRLEVQEAEWFTLLGEANQIVDLGPGEVRGVRIPVRVEEVGLHELTVFALGNELQDAVARTVLVEPDGQKVENVASGRLDQDVTRTVTLPETAIPGSGKLLVKLYPGLFSAIVEGLDGVLQMPSGCFEQTSSSTWPNVLVLRYMRETDAVTPELEATATGYVNTGYQRLLTFEVEDGGQRGGFEWFGNPPAHTVLTAYGLLEFVDMAQVRPVDEAMIQRTRDWLLGQQEADGHWEVNGRGLDETGQLTNPLTVTAYVAFALAAAGEQGPAMDNARNWLAANRADMQTYTLALYANFLAAYAPNDPATAAVMNDLAGLVQDAVAQNQQDPPPPGQFWEAGEQTTTYGQGEPAWIETTALATHALLVVGAHGNVTDQALAWLVSRKNPQGAWGSTAGTVWTIKCLLQALRGGVDENANAAISILLDGEERASFMVTPETSDVMRQADLSQWLIPGQAHEVSVRIEGEGNLQYGIVESWHVPWSGPPPGEGPLTLTVEYDRTSIEVDDRVEVSVTVTNNDVEFADMVMVDLGIPPGFDVVTQDLDALVEQGVFSRYELTQRQLLLYFTVVLPEQPIRFSYHIIARDPIRAQAPRNRVYSYYNPDVGQDTEPTDFEVQ
ncbi:MAG: MG2 domain-containing protein [Planctomycetota bacterium]|jgi:hypothetical protein